ncbi:aromatic ring-hydroxylating oxygenase subunit alpha [Paracidovorax cattleyae]|uniref:Phenylpropionate dioxygenase, large terminal subunit n=1 Tax=Paracidovorax cattleyae TaxID=80868 RepID=A0A1H0TRM6_9BURK|nr:SRPBCC family protein [Paracidovorax cattleyae]SDP56445.1 Phenylpropionate dioxygenase, large terminal subunit [Paracidovorax cattleyae]
MPMSAVSPHFYRDAGHHAAEMQGLFRESWVFVCMRLELEGLVHRGVQVAGVSLLLQCDSQGRPRAFLNVCSHRHAQLCGSGAHRGPARCPYHGWVYDREGVPVGIPAKQCFPEVVAEPSRFRLQEFGCEAVGQFVFVRIAETGPSLREYLGGQYGFLERASQGMQGVLDEFREPVEANWKIVIENALEGYHVPAVHSRTFMQIDGMDRAEAAPRFFLEDRLHSHLEHAADAEWVARFARMERKIGQWPWRFEHYTHHHIFPNLTVTSFMGYSFHVQSFEPTEARRTTVHSRTIGVEFQNSTPAGARMMEHIHEDGHAFTRKVFAEDGGICARVQAGVDQAQRPAVVGEGIEDRVAHFQNAYVHALSRGRQALAGPSGSGAA